MTNPLPNILLTEGDHPKIMAAAKRALEASVCRLTIIGDAAAVNAELDGLDGYEVIAPDNGAAFGRLVAAREAEKPGKPLPIKHPNLVQGAELLRDGQVDGLVAGGVETTDEVIVVAAKVVGSDGPISDSMVIAGPARTAVYAGCAAVEFPDEELLAHIACTSATFAKAVLGEDPVVAMIDYQTGDNAPRPKPQEVAQAAKMARQKCDYPVEGPIQLDAAMIPEIGEIKMPESEVAGGKANVFVFPDIRSGNPNYKNSVHSPTFFTGESLIKAYGPFLNGTKRPMNDLSRGSSVEEIFGTIKLTVEQAMTYT